MNLNDKRIEAYKKTAERQRDTKAGKPDKVRTYIDELMERDGLLKLVKSSKTPTPSVPPASGGKAESSAAAAQAAKPASGAASAASAAPSSGTAFSGVPIGTALQTERDSVYRRVAKFLLLIGVNEAAKVIPHLTAEQTEKIIPEIASIRSVEKDEAALIFAEFQSLLEQSRQTGGVQTARSILEKAFGADKAQAMLSKSVPYPEGVPFDYLQEISAERLNLLLKDESIPVQTLVLSRLKPALAADFIKACGKERQKEIISRMAKFPAVSTDVVKRVDRAMREKLQNLSTETGSAIDGRGALAEILKKMEPGAEKSILSVLGEQDPELSDDLRNRLFTVDDIINADDRFIQNVLRSMSDDNIVLLIAGKEEAFRTKIFRNMSKGRGDAVLEEEQLKLPVRKKESDEATQAFFAVLRSAWEEGRLTIKGRDEDVYV
ncbi:flagellar motor switch protein FliG [Treponema sp. HNW]|uniref:flagellar motor switch protein FliG n=1 Tax=Treponema sp. HNW TaxID=3116654 RepID=UPI003D0C4C4E